MQLEEQIKLALESCDVTLYDIEMAKDNNDKIYRVIITAKGGISLDKCQEVSKTISPILDINEPIKGKYRLEVSSPGIERKLKSIEHIKASIGEKVKLKEYSTISSKGQIIDVSQDNILTIQEDDNNEIKIKYDDILSISTYYEW